jgi:restriction endonuclease S subunit
LLSRHAFNQATVGATGAAQKTVSLAVLRHIKVPRTGVAEQRASAEKLDTAFLPRLDSLRPASAQLAILAELKQAILQKAFAGELTAHPEKALPEAAE